METVNQLIIIIATYILFCKIWPYFLYPNYFRRSRIENYTELKKLSLNLKNDDKFKTVENVYHYMQKIYTGHDDVWDLKNLLSVFDFGDFATDKILHKKNFLWCHSQNRLCKSILINSGMFIDDEIIIQKRFFTSLFIHQWLIIDLGDKKIEMDPYYHIFKEI